MSQSNRYKSTIAVRRVNLFYSALAGLAVAVVVALVWYILDTRERALIDRVTESTGRGVEALIQKDIEDRVILLSGLAHRWEQPAGIPRVDWEAAVRNIHETQPGYEAIGWVDTSLHVRWVLLPDGSEPVPDVDLRSRPPALAAAQAARDLDTVVLSVPLESVHGFKGFEMYLPVYRPSPDGRKFDGLMISVLLIDPLLKTLLPLDLMAEHEVIVSINGQTLFSTDPEHLVADQRWAQQRRFELYDLNWQLEVAPKAEFLLEAYSRFSSAMLTLLVLLSSLTALTVYSVLTSRGRARQVRNAARRLDRLFKNLPGMAYRCQARDPWPMEFVSDGCRTLCGYDPDELETQRVLWGELIHPDDQKMVRQAVQSSVAEQRQFQIIYRIRHRDGGERWVWEQGQGVFVDEKAVAIEGFITDITHRKRVEETLRVHNEVLERLATGGTFEHILLHLVEGMEKIRPGIVGSVLLLDSKTGSLRHGVAPNLPDFFNEAINGVEIGPCVGSCGAAAFLGKRVVVESIATHPYWEKYRALAQKAGLMACWSEPIISSTGRVLGTFAMYYRKAQSPTSADLELIQNAAHLAGITIEHNKTEQELLTYQRQLRDLASELAITEERERRKIATELHDEVGQSLAATKIKLSTLRQSGKANELAQELIEADQLLEATIQVARNLTFELVSPVLHELGLEAAIESLIEDAKRRDGISYRFDDDGRDKPMGEALKVVLFKAVRELLFNVFKYAQADSVYVKIARDDGQVKVCVEDDGVGFVLPETGFHISTQGGYGLFNINERLDYLGGRLEIECKPGQGTRVTLVAPLDIQPPNMEGEGI